MLPVACRRGASNKLFRPKTRHSRTAPQERNSDNEKQPESFNNFVQIRRLIPAAIKKFISANFTEKQDRCVIKNSRLIHGIILTFHLYVELVSCFCIDANLGKNS
jgi:hypothetical protein